MNENEGSRRSREDRKLEALWKRIQEAESSEVRPPPIEEEVINTTDEGESEGNLDEWTQKDDDLYDDEDYHSDVKKSRRGQGQKGKKRGPYKKRRAGEKSEKKTNKKTGKKRKRISEEEIESINEKEAPKKKKRKKYKKREKKKKKKKVVKKKAPKKRGRKRIVKITTSESDEDDDDLATSDSDVLFPNTVVLEENNKKVVEKLEPGVDSDVDEDLFREIKHLERGDFFQFVKGNLFDKIRLDEMGNGDDILELFSLKPVIEKETEHIPVVVPHHIGPSIERKGILPMVPKKKGFTKNFYRIPKKKKINSLVSK